MFHFFIQLGLAAIGVIAAFWVSCLVFGLILAPLKKTAPKKEYHGINWTPTYGSDMTPKQLEAWRKGPTDLEKLEMGLRTGDIVGVEIL